MVAKFALVISSRHLFVLIHLQHVNSTETSCTNAIQSIIMQLLNQGWNVGKIIEEQVAISIF